MLLPGRIYIAWGPWLFGDFCNIFLPNIGEDQKKNFTIWELALCQKVNPALVIALRLYKDYMRAWGSNVLDKNSCFYPGYRFNLVGRIELRGPGPDACRIK